MLTNVNMMTNGYFLQFQLHHILDESTFYTQEVASSCYMSITIKPFVGISVL